MKQTETARVMHKSKSTINKIVNGKIESTDKDLVMSLINFESKTLPEMISDELFLELCDVGIAKARNVKVREFASLLKHMSIRIYKMKGKGI